MKLTYVCASQLVVKRKKMKGVLDLMLSMLMALCDTMSNKAKIVKACGSSAVG